ncbi:hypothetical protein HDK64DRAFT_55118 [Phyllosticta capitalensis]|uniref:Uncharacterized protein n=1 Tax=Phyllosticta capitalensis TaxID=121624 RepID=A0ABR1YUQ9_9PEZI
MSDSIEVKSSETPKVEETLKTPKKRASVFNHITELPDYEDSGPRVDLAQLVTNSHVSLLKRIIELESSLEQLGVSCNDTNGALKTDKELADEIGAKVRGMPAKSDNNKVKMAETLEESKKPEQSGKEPGNFTLPPFPDTSAFMASNQREMIYDLLFYARDQNAELNTMVERLAKDAGVSRNNTEGAPKSHKELADETSAEVRRMKDELAALKKA